MRSFLEWLLLFFIFAFPLQAAKVEFVQKSVISPGNLTIEAVVRNEWFEVGVGCATTTAPPSWIGYRFTHWANSRNLATQYRDAWGRSLNPVSFVLLNDTTLTAHYLPAEQDVDGDIVPDWYEIEYFGNLGQAAASDSDGDGLSLLQEYQGGTHPIYGNSQVAGGVNHAASGLVTFNRAGYPTYTLRSLPIGTVAESGVVRPDTVITMPNLLQGSFGYWTLDGVAQRDAWGVALRGGSFTMGTENREAVANFFDGDQDFDGLPDAWEWYFFATTGHDGNGDLNGDGFTLLQDYQAGRAPSFGYSSQAGGVAYSDSALVTFNRDAYPSYSLRSVPAGTVAETDVVPPNTVITTPNLTEGSFGYWALDGVVQRDAWGVSLRQVSFTMGPENREAAAYMFVGDADVDGLPDAWEWYYLGTSEHGGSVDLNGDGFTLLQDYQAGRAPTFGYSSEAGGVAWADSAMITFDRAGIPIVLRASAKVGVATSISVSKLATRASSVFGPAVTVASVDAASEEGGTVVLAGSSIQYTPAVGFAGVDRFRVTFSTSGGDLVGFVEMTTTGTGSEPSPSSSLGVNPARLTPLSNGRIGVQFNGIPGVAYQLQRSTDLVSWTTITTITAGPRGEISYTDENPPSPSGFYRLSTP